MLGWGAVGNTLVGLLWLKRWAKAGQGLEPTDATWEIESGVHVARVTFALFGLEFLKPDVGSVGVFSPIDRPDPGDEGEAVADQMHNASLRQG